MRLLIALLGCVLFGVHLHKKGKKGEDWKRELFSFIGICFVIFTLPYINPANSGGLGFLVLIADIVFGIYLISGYKGNE